MGIQSKVHKPLPANEVVSEEASRVHMAIPVTDNHGNTVGGSVDEGVSMAEQAHADRKSASNHKKRVLQATSRHEKKRESPIVDELTALGQYAADHMPNIPQQHDYYQDTSGALSCPPTCQQSLPFEANDVANPSLYTYPEVAVNLPLELGKQEPHNISEATARHGDLQQVRSVENNDRMISTTGVLASNALQSDFHGRPVYREQADATRYGVSNQNAPYRVEKPKRRRTTGVSQSTQASTLARNRGINSNSGFEQALENVIVAYHVEQFRKDEDAASQVKQSDEIKALLQDRINQYAVTVSEWKDKHETLHRQLQDVRTRSITSQKFVKGLQTDHEKMKEMAKTLEKVYNETIQQKTAEIDREKKTLQHELMVTLDTLERGQRNLKATVDDLYVRLRISQSKRADLEENLNKQIALCEEEKSKRSDLEKQVSSSVQNIQRQLGGGSTQLSEKLEALQTSVDGVVQDNKQDPRIEECVTVLQKLWHVPFVTSRDVLKAEGMLRFMNDE
jgi:uncharacterized phage infection (PIP) family protein YhgE